MSSFIKTALPIVATVAGAALGMPWLGAVVDGVEGYQSGGVKGAAIGAGEGYASGALAGYGAGIYGAGSAVAGDAAGAAVADNSSVISSLGSSAGDAASYGGAAAAAGDSAGAVSSLGAGGFAVDPTPVASDAGSLFSGSAAAGAQTFGVADLGANSVTGASDFGAMATPQSVSDYGSADGFGSPGMSISTSSDNAGYTIGNSADAYGGGPAGGSDGSLLDLLKKNPALIKGGMNLVNGIYSLATSGNPMSGVEKNAANQIKQLQANPSSITSTPGYAAGIQAVQRQQAAQGYTGSGNSAAALNQFGNQFYQQQIQQLMQLANNGSAVNQQRQNVAGGLAQVGAGVGQFITPQANGGQSAFSSLLSMIGS